MFDCRYRGMHRWEDGTVGYFLKNYLLSRPPSCGRLVVVSGIIKLETPLCFLKETKSICEQGDKLEETYPNQNGQSERPRLPVIKAPLSAVPLRHAVCPLGHWTHEFLACDPQSACWQQDSLGQSSSDRNTRRNGTSVCQSRLSTLFTCRNGAEHVPYSLVCDHHGDCVDGSDEDFCTYPSCSSSFHFKCISSQVRSRRDRG